MKKHGAVRCMAAAAAAWRLQCPMANAAAVANLNTLTTAVKAKVSVAPAGIWASNNAHLPPNLRPGYEAAKWAVQRAAAVESGDACAIAALDATAASRTATTAPRAPRGTARRRSPAGRWRA